MEHVLGLIRRNVGPVIGALAFVVAALAAPPAGGAVIGVTTTVDQTGVAPGCSLRQAVSAADLDVAQGGCPKGSGADTIRLQSGVYPLTLPGAAELLNQTGDLNVQNAGAITIEPAGNGPVTIDANQLDRAILNDGGGSLSLHDITIRRGSLDGMVDGAGILNASGKLTLEGVTITGSRAQAGDGGALANYDALVVLNSTLSGNNAKGNGGGLYAAGGTTNSIRSTTISGNAADAFGTNSGDGGGIASAATATVNATNTIIAGNFDNSPGAGSVAPDCSTGPSFFPRHTLLGDPSPALCLVGFDPGTNLTGDPRLGPLADNGGLTPTRLPLAGSPVIDAGGSAAPDACPALDQRGVTRPKGAGCDIGAVERDPLGIDAEAAGAGAGASAARLFLAKPRPRRTRVRRGATVRYRLRVRNTGGSAARRVRVCLAISKSGRRAVKPIGRRCRRLGRIAAGRTKVARFSVRVRKGARAGKVKIRFKVRAAGLKARKRTAVLRVR